MEQPWLSEESVLICISRECTFLSVIHVTVTATLMYAAAMAQWLTRQTGSIPAGSHDCLFACLVFTALSAHIGYNNNNNNTHTCKAP